MGKITMQVMDHTWGVGEMMAEIRPKMAEHRTPVHADFSLSHDVSPLVIVEDPEDEDRVTVTLGSKKYRPLDPPLSDQLFLHDAVPGGEVCLNCEDLEIRNLLSGGGGRRQYSLGWLQDVANCQGCGICHLLTTAFEANAGSNFPRYLSGDERCFVTMDVLESVTPFPSVRRNRPYELRGLLLDGKTSQLRAVAYIRPSVKSGALLGKRQMFCGRIVDTAVADLKLARAWIDECCDTHPRDESSSDKHPVHGTTPSDQYLRGISGDKSLEDEKLLRLIDVADGNLCLRPWAEKYITLSYVWPCFEALRLVKSNSEELHSPAGLFKLQHKLPKVIRHAIDVVRELGERYLWVDAVCITQDDENEKKKLINAMNLVYGNCLLTLVVATVTPPVKDYGIPGINGTPRMANQHFTDVEGLQLFAALAGPHPSVKQSVWSTRGWTFQENLLTRRSLILSDQQMFFRCPHDYRAEDVQTEGCETFTRHPARPEPQEEQMQYLTGPAFFKNLSVDRAFHEYSQIVRAYTPRSFTNADDILNGFTGVMKAMIMHLPKPQGFFIGLPLHAFDRALLWYPTSRLERREAKVVVNGSPNQLPTWSWAGWKGSVEYEKGTDRVGDWESQKTMVIWWRRQGDNLVPIKNINNYITRTLELSWCMLMARVRNVKPTQLVFWGTCVELSVSSNESYIKGWLSDWQQTLPCFALLDSDGHQCGILPSADREWAKRHVTSPGSSSYQFLLLAYASQSEADQDANRSRWLHPKFEVSLPSGDTTVNICFYSIMLLEFDAEGIAYRRGVGRVHRDAVDRHLGEFQPQIIILG